MMEIMMMTITMIHMLITMVIMIAMMMIKNYNNDTDYDRLVIKQDNKLLPVVIIFLSSNIVQTGR